MAGPLISAKVIKPKFWSGRDVSGAVLAELKNEQVPAIMADFVSTISTWRHQPVFHPVFRFAGGNVRVFIFTDDKIWVWLNNGTSVRYATMKKGFKPKTSHRIKPGAGSPGLEDPMFVSRKFPKPGIEARDWTGIITRKHKTRFSKGIQAAVNRAMAKRSTSP